jgi:membrane protein implicated in regulation of membrane protease activity
MKRLKPISCVFLAVVPELLYAYVGPGVGLSAIGSVLAFIGAIFLLIVGFLWYPIKRFLKRRQKPDEDVAAGPDAQDDGTR